MPNPVSTINVFHQIGQEASAGAGGAAGTKLQSLKIEPGDELTVKQIMALGHRFDTGVAIDQAWTSFALSADVLTYTEHLYALENLLGTVAPSVVGVGTQKRVYDALTTGNITPKTWVHQFGDAADNVNSYAYGLLTDYGEKFDREAGNSPSGAGIAQLLATGGTFTASPRVLALQPVQANHVNYYLDTTGAGLGTTQITDEINAVEWNLKGMKTARWASDRSQASFKGHVDVKPTADLKITLFEDSVTRAIVAALKAASTYFLRIDAQGPLIDNLQTVGVGAASAGTFTLTYKGQTTGNIAFNATASAVQTALIALSTIGSGNVSVTGAAPTWTVAFVGALAQDATLMTGSGGGLTGGALTITAAPQYYLARRDLAFKVSKIAAFKDTKGIYAREVTGTIMEDATWGHALQLTSQTKEATL